MTANNNKNPRTDFNDLHLAEGLAVVRDQIMAVLGESPAPSDDAVAANEAFPSATAAGQVGSEADLPRTPSTALAPLSLNDALQRFALAMPDGKVWDAHNQQLLKVSAASKLMGKKLYNQWADSEQKRTVQQEDVLREASAAQAKGGGELGTALERYVYLYPTDGVWDNVRREIVPISSLKLAIASIYDTWLKSAERQQIDREKLVFDPTQQVDSSHINMFRGLPLKPEGDETQCAAIIELVQFLCNGDMEVFHWLICWLAYPLQNVGAKMATAVMMHSEIQGSGKSLFFDGVMRKIYGEYGATLGQHQLESQYTDWRSQKLFGLFEEIFSRDQKYSHTGTVKHMITGDSQRIEKKFVSGWEEANHMNAVFLSNEIQPFHVEPSDRRMLVVWPKATLCKTLQERCAHELEHGGPTAFYRWLLSQDLGDFGPHTKPPMTDAKERLIDFGRPGWDTFYREWQRGSLDVPYATCLVQDLYAVYQRWCRRTGERDVSLTKFAGFISTRERHRRDVRYSGGQNGRKGTFFVIGTPPDDTKQADWLALCVQNFQKEMETGAPENG